MQVKDLNHNPKNPRKVTEQKLKQLKKAILEFGDLSGIVYNLNTHHIVGGHQRSKIFDQTSKIVITKKHEKPTVTGTVAEGHLIFKGERFAYREVAWDEQREKAANLAANKGAGEWDLPQLSLWVKELTSFDSNFDTELTMFTKGEIKALSDVTVKEHTRKAKGDADKELKPPKCKRGQIYLLGGTRLRCGGDELHFCDEVLLKWTKYSGQTPILQTESTKPAIKKLKKTLNPSISRHA